MELKEKQQKLDLAHWSKLAHLGSANAISGLSQMVCHEMSISAVNLEEISIRNVNTLIGKAEDQIIGIYLRFTGHSEGQIVMAFDPKVAFELIDMAMGLPTGSTQTLEEMEESVLGEMGNIVGTFFLNAVADYAGLRLIPSCPSVVSDMAGAIIGSVMTSVFEQTDSAFVIRLVFSTSDREIQGRFIVLPNFDSCPS